MCYRKEGPCGGVASGAPSTTLIGGKDFSILFQQNLNHYYVDNPGKFVADFATNADPTEADFTPLGLPISDYNAVSSDFNFFSNIFYSSFFDFILSP